MAIKPVRGQHENGKQRTVELREDGSVSIADAAALLGVTSQSVRDWIARGCPHNAGGRGRGRGTTVNMSEIVDWRVADLGGRAVGQTATDDDGQVYDLELAKAVDKHYQALSRQAQARKELGQLVAVDLIADVVESEYQKVRSQLNSVASRLAVPIAAETDAAVTRRMIGDAIARALSALSEPDDVIKSAGGDPSSSVYDRIDLDATIVEQDDDDVD